MTPISKLEARAAAPHKKCALAALAVSNYIKLYQDAVYYAALADAKLARAKGVAAAREK